MCEQEYEETPTVRRRAEKTDAPTAPQLCGHAHLCPGAGRGKARARQDPQDRASRQVRGGADAHDQLPGVSGPARHQTLHLVLHERDEGLPGLSYRAGRQLGQVCWSVFTYF